MGEDQTLRTQLSGSTLGIKRTQCALAYIAPLLRQAYVKRHAIHDQRLQSKQKEYIGLLEKYLVLLRAFINKKDTINR
jgi:hypothetical protein